LKKKPFRSGRNTEKNHLPPGETQKNTFILGNKQKTEKSNPPPTAKGATPKLFPFVQEKEGEKKKKNCWKEHRGNPAPNSHFKGLGSTGKLNNSQ